MANSKQVWRINRERAVDYLNTRNRIYVVDGFAGWDERYRINVRVVCARAYHALFMRNMLIRPKPEELVHFEPDYTIYNAGTCKLCNSDTYGKYWQLTDCQKSPQTGLLLV
jgi:phosphoenolpyruvate carboxykinase (ATP)